MKEEWAAARVAAWNAAWEEISNGFREIEQPLPRTLCRTMVRYCRAAGPGNMPATATATAALSRL